MKHQTYAIIVCGGSGSRLWPRSRSEQPKHLLSLDGAKTLVQQTIDRLDLPADHIYCITEVSHADGLRDQLPEIPLSNIIVEPGRRGTASAIGLALSRLRGNLDPDAVVTVLWADSFIKQSDEFRKTIAAWVEAARATNRIVNLGVRPTYPSTGFGYINFAETLTEVGNFDVYATKAFVEKPNEETAQDYVESGQYLWNTGMFAATVGVLEREFLAHLPHMMEQLTKVAEAEAAGNPTAAADAYLELPNEILEYGLLEKSDNLAVIPASFDWIDIGSWADLHDLIEQDSDGNVFDGNYVDIDSHNCFIYSPNHLVATVGLDNLVVINTGDAVLICPKDRAQDVKKVVDQLKKRNMTKYL